MGIVVCSLAISRQMEQNKVWSFFGEEKPLHNMETSQEYCWEGGCIIVKFYNQEDLEMNVNTEVYKRVQTTVNIQEQEGQFRLCQKNICQTDETKINLFSNGKERSSPWFKATRHVSNMEEVM